jgi:glycosyltransferase involved in cell wall biosynthesis
MKMQIPSINADRGGDPPIAAGLTGESLALDRPPKPTGTTRLLDPEQDSDESLAAGREASEARAPEITGVAVQTLDRIRRHRNVATLSNTFDEVFLVNLQRDAGKRYSALKHLNSQGIWPRLWSASYGYDSPLYEQYLEYRQRPLGDLSDSEFSQLEIRRGSKFISSPGAWGYLRTYESLLQHALESNLRRILILEDDVLLCHDFQSRFGQWIERVPKDWKLLQLGASQYNWNSAGDLVQAAAKGFYTPQVIDTCGSFAIAIDHAIIQQLLEQLRLMDSPFDFITLGKIYQTHPSHCFVAYPNLVVPDVSTSSIREGRDQVAHAQCMKWQMDQFPFPRGKVSATIAFSDPNQVGISFGSSELEKQLDINWLYFHARIPRPIHTSETVTRLRTASTATMAIPEEMEQTLLRLGPELTTDFVLLLDPQIAVTESVLRTCFDDLVQGRVPQGRGVRVLCPAPAQSHPNSVTTPLVLQEQAKQIQKARAISDSKSEGPATFRWIGPFPPQADTGQQALVSVVISTYRRPKHLVQAVKSVLDQTYPSIEILVIDDNDPASIERLQTRQALELFRGESRVRYVEHGANLGGASARNTGLMLARGNFISFLDDDDVYLPRKIEASVAAIESEGAHVGAVYTGFTGWNSKENDLSRYRSGKLTLEILSLDYTKHYLCTNTALYRRSALLRTNGYDEAFRRHTDLEFHLRFFELYDMGTVPEALVQLRPTPIDDSNLLDGPRLLDVKRRFFSRFKHVIERFSLPEQQRIYAAHWKEVVRYFGGSKGFVQFLRESAGNELASSVVTLFDHALDELTRGNPEPLSACFTSAGNKTSSQGLGIDSIVEALEWQQLGNLEQLSRLVRSTEQTALSVSEIRDLPRLLCLALDLRHALDQNEMKRARQSFTDIRSRLPRHVAWLLGTCLFPHRTQPNPQFEARFPAGFVTSFRELVLGPLIQSPWLELDAIRLGHLEQIGWYHALKLDTRMSELLVSRSSFFLRGNPQGVGIRPQGIVIRPLSASRWVSLRLRTPTTSKGTTQGLIVQAPKRKGRTVILQASRSSRFRPSITVEIPGDSKDLLVPLPLPAGDPKREELHLRVRVSEGDRAEDVRLILSGFLIAPRRQVLTRQA